MGLFFKDKEQLQAERDLLQGKIRDVSVMAKSRHERAVLLQSIVQRKQTLSKLKSYSSPLREFKDRFQTMVPLKAKFKAAMPKLKALHEKTRGNLAGFGKMGVIMQSEVNASKEREKKKAEGGTGWHL